jgi:hypothetical protein
MKTRIVQRNSADSAILMHNLRRGFCIENKYSDGSSAGSSGLLFLLIVGGVNTLSAEDEFSASTICADAETEPPECECLDIEAIGFAAL